MPQNLGYIDRTDPEHWLEYEVSFRVTKKTLPDIISRCMTRNGTRACAKMLDAIKAQGYKYSTLSAISVAVCDAVIPPQKSETDRRRRQAGLSGQQAVQPRPDLRQRALQPDHRHLAGNHR